MSLILVYPLGVGGVPPVPVVFVSWWSFSGMMVRQTEADPIVVIADEPDSCESCCAGCYYNSWIVHHLLIQEIDVQGVHGRDVGGSCWSMSFTILRSRRL